MKRYFRNQRGFTLVELMATLGILALIVAIAVPAIGGIMAKADKQAKEAQDKLIIKSAKIAESNYLESTYGVIPGPREGELVYTVKYLVDKGYLDVDYINTYNYGAADFAKLTDRDVWDSVKVQKVRGDINNFTVERGNY